MNHHQATDGRNPEGEAMAKTKQKSSEQLLTRCQVIARDLLIKHVETVDGERCFNLYRYLETLESRLIAELDGPFELDPSAVARFLWCSLCSAMGQDPAGTKFNGLPILD